MRRLARRPVLLTAAIVSLAACATQPVANQNYVVFFEPWSASLDPAAQASVASAAQWARQHPGNPVGVVGFASTVGTKPANAALSKARAEVVVAELVKDGVDRSRITQSARGPTDVTLEDVEARRVDIAIAGR